MDFAYGNKVHNGDTFTFGSLSIQVMETPGHTGGIAAWYKSAGEIGTFGVCSVQELNRQLDTSTPFILDVRDIKNRRASGHIRNSHHVYVGELPHHLKDIPENEPVFIYCDAGYKGSLAASILAQHHYRRITNVLGGMTAWKQAGLSIEH